MDFLKGKKTYLVAALWALATFAHSAGYIDSNIYQMIQGILFPAGIASLRAGISK